MGSSFLLIKLHLWCRGAFLCLSHQHQISVGYILSDDQTFSESFSFGAPLSMHICSVTCVMELMCRPYLYIQGKECFENEGDEVKKISVTFGESGLFFWDKKI